MGLWGRNHLYTTISIALCSLFFFCFQGVGRDYERRDTVNNGAFCSDGSHFFTDFETQSCPLHSGEKNLVSSSKNIPMVSSKNTSGMSPTPDSTQELDVPLRGHRGFASDEATSEGNLFHQKGENMQEPELSPALDISQVLRPAQTLESTPALASAQTLESTQTLEPAQAFESTPALVESAQTFDSLEDDEELREPYPLGREVVQGILPQQMVSADMSPINGEGREGDGAQVLEKQAFVEIENLPFYEQKPAYLANDFIHPDHEDFAHLSLSDKVGQLIMVGFRGMGEPEETSMQPIVQSIAEGKVGGVILFDYDVTSQSAVRNIQSLVQVARLTHSLQQLSPIPLFISVDQEGGRVMRLKSALGMPELSSPRILGSGDVEYTAQMTGTTAQYLAALGVNVNFAPGVDVDIDPLSPAIGKLERSYSADPATVALHADAYAQALEHYGLVCTFKHFPGHGSAVSDTHLGLADVTETWRGEELEPYKTLLPKHPYAMVMIGHVFHRLLDDVYPASLSKNIINGLLRHELGWDGLVITDDLDMQAISNYYSVKECVGLALNAGVDILLFGNNLQYDPTLPSKVHQSVLELVEEGRVSVEQIDASCRRVLLAKHALYGASSVKM